MLLSPGECLLPLHHLCLTTPMYGNPHVRDWQQREAMPLAVPKPFTESLRPKPV